jgi:GDP-4-dehydro-6-deoxy-D-mannose reductase
MERNLDWRVLLTGANGFVGRHLGVSLRGMFGDRIAISATSRISGHDRVLGAIEILDVTDAAAVALAIRIFQPTHVINMAGLASVPAAAANVEQAWRVHVSGLLNVANAILAHAPTCVLLSVGTGQVYGTSARTCRLLDEGTVLAPTNSYEVTKAAGDLALGAAAHQGLRCVRLRPFNHTGPGQTEDFVIPSFAMQIARIEAGLQEPVLRVGNLDAERDFLDVRDVTAAYALAIAKSEIVPSGTILNIASGVPHPIRELLDRLLAHSTMAIKVETDQSRMRPSDTPRFAGDATRARELLGWSPTRLLDATLRDVLDFSRAAVRANRSLP